MSGIVLCPEGYKMYIAGKVPEFGDLSFQWMGKGDGKEQRQRIIQSCPRPQITQE